MRTIRQAARSLARTPQFTVAAVITLALAIGTNASIFSVVQGVLLKPLRFEESDRLVLIGHTAPGLGYDRFGMSPGLFSLYARQGEAFSAAGLYAGTSVNVTGDGAPPSRVDAARASAGVFEALGTAPLAGRTFDATDGTEGAAPTVVISEAFWQERFGGARDVLGRTVRVNGELRTVVGVMPSSFEFPNRDTRLWLPLPVDTTAQDYGNFTLDAVARLRNGLDAAAAESRLAPVLTRLMDEAPDLGDFRAFVNAGQVAAVVTPLKEIIVGDVSRALWILLGTVAFVFLIACANVTNLFLVRAETRHTEMAVRAAMGAGRRSLIGTYAAEALLIAGAGGVIGLGLTFAALRALLHVAPPNIPRLHEVAIDPVVLAFTAAITILGALLLGVLPALRLTSPDLLNTLSRSTRGSSAGRERHRARQLLVVAQTALALVLLIGSGLMVRSFNSMRAVDPGFVAADAYTFRVSLPQSTYPDSSSVARFHQQLLERLRALPGVQYAGATSHLPLGGCCSGTAHVVEDRPVQEGELPPMFWWVSVSDGYFDAMQIPIIAGREFDSSDRDPARGSIIVSRALADEFWPGANPIGERIRLSGNPDFWYNIVGVAGNVRARELEEGSDHVVYYPIAANIPGQTRSMTYVVRTPQPETISERAREQVWSIDPDLPIAASSTYEQIVADSMVRISFTMLALVVAAFIALVLGAIGLYSVISYLVTQRTNEIGIRIALGAQPRQVLRMIVAQGTRLAAVGLVVGVAGAFALTRLMQGMLFGIDPTDPLTFVAVTTLLGGIAFTATYLPARRASRIDPARSLKVE